MNINEVINIVCTESQKAVYDRVYDPFWNIIHANVSWGVTDTGWYELSDRVRFNVCHPIIHQITEAIEVDGLLLRVSKVFIREEVNVE